MLPETQSNIASCWNYELLLGGSEDDLMLLHNCLPTVWYQVSEAAQAVDSSESHTSTS